MARIDTQEVLSNALNLKLDVRRKPDVNPDHAHPREIAGQTCRWKLCALEKIDSPLDADSSRRDDINVFGKQGTLLRARA